MEDALKLIINKIDKLDKKFDNRLDKVDSRLDKIESDIIALKNDSKSTHDVLKIVINELADIKEKVTNSPRPLA